MSVFLKGTLRLLLRIKKNPFLTFLHKHQTNAGALADTFFYHIRIKKYVPERPKRLAGYYSINKNTNVISVPQKLLCRVFGSLHEYIKTHTTHLTSFIIYQNYSRISNIVS